MKKNELSYKNLKTTCNPDIFKFETTLDVEPTDSGIGQDRGIKALEFGVSVDVENVTAINKVDDYFEVVTDYNTYQAKSVILAICYRIIQSSIGWICTFDG